jgi:hypothetical protein
VGRVVTDIGSLDVAAREELADPGRKSAGRRELAATLLYNPGRGASTAADRILEMIGLDR